MLGLGGIYILPPFAVWRYLGLDKNSDPKDIYGDLKCNYYARYGL